MRRIFPFFICLIFSIAAYGKVVDYIIAVVNNSPILYSEVKRYSKLNKLPEKDALQRLINERLLLQEAEKEKVTIPDALVEEAIMQLAKNNGFKNEEEFRKALKKDGIPMEELRKEIKNQLLVKKFLSVKFASKIRIPEEDTEKFCKEKKDKIRAVSYITTDNETLANIIRNSIEKEGFPKGTEICNNNTDCKSGFLGNVEKGTLIKEIDTAIWNAQIKTPVTVKKDNKYFILYVTEEKTNTCDIEKVKKELADKLYRQELEKLLKKLQNENHIEIFTISNR